MLEVVEVVEPREAKDGRLFQTVRFQQLDREVEINGVKRQVKSNEPVRTRNLWELTPQGDRKMDPLFGQLNEGDIVDAEIHTVDLTKDEPKLEVFIPSEYGKETNSKGQRGNWVSHRTVVVWKHEDLKSYIDAEKRSIINSDQEHRFVGESQSEPVQKSGSITEEAQEEQTQYAG